MNGEARVEHVRGHLQIARALYEDALARFERQHDAWGAGDSLLALGLVAVDADDLAAARTRLARAHEVFGRVSDVRNTLRVLEAFAHVAAAAGAPERALMLAGAAAAVRHTLSVPLPGSQLQRVEATLERVRRQLDPQRAAAAWMEGWSLSIDEAIALAFAG